MRRTLLSIISFLVLGFVSNQVLAQCDPPSQLPSEPFCTGAPSPCLEGTCFSTGGSTSGGGTDFCGPGTGLQNPQYFQFIASATTVVFNITVTCNSGSGLQLAIIDPPDPCTDWTAANVLTCFNGLAGPGIVTVGGLVVGETYLFLIDGFSGAVCEYLFNDITGVEEPPSIPDMIGMVSGPDTICPGGTALFSVDWSDPNAYKYFWYVKEVASIKKITVQPPVGIDPSVSLTFPANLPEGDYTVCVYGYNGCDTTNNELCKIINLKKIVTVPVDTTVCKEKLPFKYVGAPPPNSNNTFNAPGTFPVKFKSAQGCDSIIQFTLDVPLFTYNPNLSQNYGAVCASNKKYTFPPNMVQYLPGTNIKITLKAQESGCDSIVYLNVISLNPDANINVSGKLSCTDPADTIVILEGWYDTYSLYNQDVVNPPFNASGEFPTFNYIWKNSAGMILAQGPNAGMVIVSKAGTYKLIFSITMFGITCTDSTTVMIDKEVIPPITPIIDGDDEVCRGDVSQVFTVTNPDPDLITVIWQLPVGATIVSSTPDSVSVTINFAGNSATGIQQVCAIVVAICGRDTTCFPITVNSLPTGSLAVSPDSVCLGSSANLIFNLSGNGPFTVIYSAGGVNDTLTGITNGQSLSQSITATTTFNLISIEEQGGGACRSIINSSKVINVTVPKTAVIEPTIEVCNAVDPNGITPTGILFDTIVVSGSTTGTWINVDNPAGVTGTLPTLDFTGVGVGTYTFNYKLTNPAPCTDSIYSMEVTVRNCLCPSTTVGTANALCNDNDTIHLNGLQITTEPGTWVIVGNTVPAATLAGNILNVTGAGAGTVYVRFNLTNPPPAGCADTSSSVAIVVNKEAFANILTDTVDVCNIDPSNTGKTMLNFTSLFIGAGSDPGAWKDINGVNVANPANVDFTGFIPGSVHAYSYVVTGTSPCANKSYTIFVKIKDCSCPDASTTAPSPRFCNDNDILDLTPLVTATKPGKWSIVTNVNPAAVLTGSSLNVTGAGVGFITVRFTLDVIPTGCVGYTEQTFEVISPPSTQFITLDTLVCNAAPFDPSLGSPILDLSDLIVSGDATGNWKLNGVGPNITAPIDFNGYAEGAVITYTYFTAAAQVPCGNVQYTLNATVIDCNCPKPNTKALDTLCNSGGNLDLNDYKFGNTAPGVWAITGTPPAGSLPFVSLNGSLLDANNVQPGTYELTYTIDQKVAGCVDSSKQYLVVEALPFAGTAGTDATCFGSDEQIDICALLVGANAGGTWIASNPGSFDQATCIFNTSAQIAGDYTFEYSVNGTRTCPTDKETVSIKINPLPIANAGADDILTCDEPTSVIGIAAVAGNNYSWKEIVSNKVVPNSTSSTTTVNVSGTYELTVTVAATGCTAVDVVTIDADNNVISGVPIDSTAPTCFGQCDGSIVIDPLTIIGGQAPFTITLNGAPTSGFSFQNLCNGTYNIQITDVNGCGFPIVIVLNEPPFVTVELGNNRQIQPGDTTILSPVISIPSADVGTITITDELGNIVCSDISCFDLAIAPASTTTYTILVTDKNGCSSSDVVVVTVKGKKTVFIPSGFTPDGDGVNDLFSILPGVEVKSVKSFTIFNRWGGLLYELYDFVPSSMIGWDGTTGGKRNNPGVFIYAAEVLFKDGTTRVYKGDVTLSSNF